MSVQTYTLGQTTISLTCGETHTQFADGATVVAAHEDVAGLGQARTATDLGYSAVSTMNREHDLWHTRLATWLGFSASPTLRAVATSGTYRWAGLEEAAVLAVTRWAVAEGIAVETRCRENLT
jgi:hypothetical protein